MRNVALAVALGLTSLVCIVACLVFVVEKLNRIAQALEERQKANKPTGPGQSSDPWRSNDFGRDGLQ